VTNATVAIIGGGITGLAAAHTLQKLGTPWVLVEAAPFLGGVIRTESRDGFLLEGGPDSILAQKPEGLALVRELGLGDPEAEPDLAGWRSLVERIKAMTPLGRLAEPEEVALAILFLASPAAGMITGHTLAVDGGFLAQ